MSLSVRVREGEPLDSAIRRLKRITEKEGKHRKLREIEFHQKGSKLKQRAIAAAKKRLQKRLSRDTLLSVSNSKGKRR